MSQFLTRLSFTLLPQGPIEDNKTIKTVIDYPDQWPDLFLPPYLSLSMQPAQPRQSAVDDGEYAYDVVVWFDGPIDVTALHGAASASGFVIEELDIAKEGYDEAAALEDNYTQQKDRDVLPLGYVDVLRRKEDVSYSAYIDVAQGARGKIHLWAPQAFGDGFHPTTHMCLQFMEELYDDDALSHKKEKIKVLDAGTGSGVLSLLAYALWRAEIYATDIDRPSVEAFAENWKRNKFDGDDMHAFCSDHLRLSEIEGAAPYAIACANMVREPLLSLIPDIAKMQQEKDILMVSGYTPAQAEQVLDEIQGQGYRLEKKKQQEDWCAALLFKLS